jgi:hypothetical protein
VNAQLTLIGRSNPEQVDYSIRNRTLGAAATFDFEIGPVVSHLFQVGIQWEMEWERKLSGHQSGAQRHLGCHPGHRVAILLGDRQIPSLPHRPAIRQRLHQGQVPTESATKHQPSQFGGEPFVVYGSFSMNVNGNASLEDRPILP